jgi:hypothetical protein
MGPLLYRLCNTVGNGWCYGEFPRYGNIFEEAVGDSMAIVVRRSRDIYSVVSFTYQHGSGRDQTSIMWIFAQLGWKIMAYWGYFAESVRVGEAWLHCCTVDFTLPTIHIFCFWVFLLCDNCRGRCFPLFSYEILFLPCTARMCHSRHSPRNTCPSINKNIWTFPIIEACSFLGGHFPCHSFFKSYVQNKMVGKQDKLRRNKNRVVINIL